MSLDDHMQIDLNPEYPWTPIYFNRAFLFIGYGLSYDRPNTYVFEAH